MLTVVHFVSDIWTNPRVTGENVTNENGEIEYYNRFIGTVFISLEILKASSFLKGGDFFLLFEEKGEHYFLENCTEDVCDSFF